MGAALLPLAGATTPGPISLGEEMLAGTGGALVLAPGAGDVPGGGGRGVTGGGASEGKGELSSGKSEAAFVACAKATPEEVSNTRAIAQRLNLRCMGLSHA